MHAAAVEKLEQLVARLKTKEEELAAVLAKSEQDLAAARVEAKRELAEANEVRRVEHESHESTLSAVRSSKEGIALGESKGWVPPVPLPEPLAHEQQAASSSCCMIM